MSLRNVKYTPVSMSGTSVWLKLKVVVWKNFIIRKHHWCLSLFEIALPVVLFVLIAYTRAKIDVLGKKEVLEPTYNQEKSSQQFYADKFNPDSRILYAPDTEFTTKLIDKIRLKLTINIADVKGFSTESDLVAYYEKYQHNETVFGISFKNVLGSGIPSKLEYVLRPFEKYVYWDTQQLYNDFPQYIPEYGSTNYIQRGFIPVQMALETSYIELASNKPLPYSLLTMQEFPYPPYLNDMGITDMFLFVLPLVTLFSFSLLCTALLKRVVEEKNTGIKELMRMMGLQSWMLWLGWFIHSFLVNLASVLIITFLMKVPLWDAKFSPIQYCDASLLFVFLVLYCAASITFCFAVSSIFNRPTLAMIFGVLGWMLSYSVPKGIVDHAPNMDWYKKVLFGIFPNMALSFGYEAISIYESREVGANWGNLFESASGGKYDITMGNVFVMFLIEIVIFLLFTVYIENINPGPYGLAKPFHYPISCIWRRISKTGTKIEDNENNGAKKYCKVEDAPDLKVGLQIKNLVKRFGKEAAVNGLSIDIYEGQITALLGHNGAGKTTTMSIITGMIAATRGSVLINGLDIKHNMDTVRGTLGLCPQHNLQFKDLTVLEHLVFFGMLKGLSKSDAQRESHDLLERMNLTSKQDSLASKLSGGMRRKLSLGIALIGTSKVLILDEPTSGLDPEARREIWDMLLSLRGSRTIIITTHFMEEADVLGDRIAIMDHGRLICYGTSMFLKKEYGTGYHLTIIRDKESVRHNQVDAITQLIRDEVTGATLQSCTGNQLTYLLPHETKSQFGELLIKLEQAKEELGITNIGMSVTTLEEVFLKVGNLATREDQKQSPTKITNCSDSTSSIHSSRSHARLTGNNLMKLQLSGLLRKRWWVLKSKWLTFCILVLIAISITLLTLYLGEGASEPSEKFTKFDFNLKKYGETSVVYGGTGSSDPKLSTMIDHYQKLASSQLGRLKPANEKSVSDVIIDMGKDNIAYYKQHMVVAAEFNMTKGKTVINAMYSNKALHGAPISLNLLMNAALKSVMGDEYSIVSGNLPLPVVADRAFEASEIEVAILWFMLFPLGMLFLSGTFLLFPLMERVSKIKQLQLMCGIRSVWYWLMCYIFDLVLYLFAICFLLLCMVIYGSIKVNTFTGWIQLETLFIILIVYGLCVIPYSYLFSYKETAASGFSSFLISTMFVSHVMTIAVIVLESSGDDYYINVGKSLKYVFSCFPQFGLTYSVVQFSRKTAWNHNWDIKPTVQKDAICRYDHNPCCDGASTPQCSHYQSYFNGEYAIKDNVIIMAASTFIYFAIVLILETTLYSKLRDKFYIYVYNKVLQKKKDVTDAPRKTNKEDVLDETQRVYTTLEREKSQRVHAKNTEDHDLLLVHQLEKMYWNNKAVDGVSFGVKAGDCFGLLGVNGAGKTTTFRMLTGDEPLLTGDARISEPSSHDKVYISKDTKKYLEKVGYCPQFDAINEVLTGREMLTLFAQLRGIHEEVDKEVNMWIKVLGLEDYANKPCGDYSGGNKRKLSMAVALIGSPLLVMLDEPTSGVDPVSRRKLWDTLTALQKQEDKPSFLLTSHSMEECEALCNKLAIMKAGQLECYGTIPELKQKYGQGFTVMLKLKSAILTITVNPLGYEDATSTESGQSHPLQNGDQVAFVNKKRKSKPNTDVIAFQEVEEVKMLQNDFESQYKGVCTLRDKHSGLLHYHINDKNKRWSELFSEIESLKHRHPVIEDYNISETTLEEVFLSIARSEN